MMSAQPLVSILINNYNYGRFLRDAIDSALDQTYPNVEVIVVDDGSADNSREIIATYGNRIVPVLKDNGGQASAFNAGFAASKGAWIHLLDSDDFFHAKKVERVCELAAECPSVGLIAHNLEYCTADGAPLDFLPAPIRRRRLVDHRQAARRGKLTACLSPTSSLCIRRDVLGHVLPMPEEIRVTADNYVEAVVLSLVPVLLLPESLAKQRIHGANFYSVANEEPGVAARLHCTAVDATVTFHLRKEHPHLARMAWRRYGRILYQLWRCRSEKSRAIEAEIRARYSVIDFTPWCIVYVGRGFVRTFVEGLVRELKRLSVGSFI
jgi:glycosyltransferase involved in cell wall biosynthesis